MIDVPAHLPLAVPEGHRVQHEPSRSPAALAVPAVEPTSRQRWPPIHVELAQWVLARRVVPLVHGRPTVAVSAGFLAVRACGVPKRGARCRPAVMAAVNGSA